MKKTTDQSSDSLYLSRLRFTKKDRSGIMNYLLNNIRVVALIVIGIFGWGISALFLLPQESSPEVNIPFGIVSVGLPGSSPADVEELILKELEDDIVNLSGVREVTATASNSFGSIAVEFNANEDIDEAIRRLRDAVDRAEADLPEDATDPVVSEVAFENQPIWYMSITGPYDNFTLRQYAEMIEDKLLALSGTSDVLISGGDIEEIRVTIDPLKLEQYGITTNQVLQAVSGNDLTLPLGTIEISGFEYSVRMEANFDNAVTIRTIPVQSADGSIIRVQDVALVTERAANNDVISRFSIAGGEPNNAVRIDVVKKSGASIIELIDDGKAAIEELKKTEFPADIEIETTFDESEIIRDDVAGLQRDGLFTIILVSIVLFLFVGLKEALIAGLSIPLVFAATFGFMLMFGITINFLSLFSLILSLGLLVDDAIVVVQATKQYLRTGKFTPSQAVLLVFRDFKTLILTTSLTTIFAFAPLLLATGIIGEFIRSIPLTVSLTLISSTTIALLINHPMAAVFETVRPTKGTYKTIAMPFFILFVIALISSIVAPSSATLIAVVVLAVINFVFFFIFHQYLREKLLANEDKLIEEAASAAVMKKRIYDKYINPENTKKFWNRITSGLVKMDRILPYYDWAICKILKSGFKQVMVLVIAAFLFIGAVFLPASGTLKYEFFASTDFNLIFVDVELPPGTARSETEKVVEQVEEVLLKEPNIANFSTIIGSAGIDSSGDFTGSSSSNSNIAQIQLNLYDEDERPEPIKSYIYSTELRDKLAHIETGKIEVAELSGGPPTGADFNMQIKGDDLAVLEQQANKYRDIVAEIPGTINENTSLTLSPGEFTFRLKPDQLALRGISAFQVASTLRTAISSSEVMSFLREGDDISVVAEFAEDSIPSIDAIKNLKIINNFGEPVVISEIADVEIGSALNTISRIDQKRVVQVSAVVEEPFLPAEVQKEFEARLAADPLPDGYEASFGGLNETNNESVLSILQAMALAFALIVATMIVQFNSFRKAILVLATIPLAITGVFYGLTAVGLPLSFPALIGILALFGIVVKNAIILVEKINQNIRVGIEFRDAIIDAAKARMEAIFLTTISTVIGMIPITFRDETWTGLGASLIFGLIASTMLTLIVLPTLYYMIFKGTAVRDAKIMAIRQAKLAEK